MYCGECRHRGRFPWEHGPDCVEALRHRIRWYEAGIPWLLLLLVSETILLLIAYGWLAKVP